MQIQEKQLKPLSSVEISSSESMILKWIRSVKWEAVAGAKEPAPLRAKVPEFYLGVQLYRKQGGGPGGSMGALDVFIKKLGFSGVIGKQDLYPVSGIGVEARYLTLKKAELNNLGVGQEDEDDE